MKPQELKPINLHKKSHKLRWAAVGAVLLFLLTTNYLVLKWGDTHKVVLHFPVEVNLYQPVKIESRADTVGYISPLSKPNKTTVFDVGAIADKIYTLESSNGKADGCRVLGLYNGYGFRQNSAEWKCYGSHDEVRSLVINWLETHIKQGDIEASLCVYNRGVNEHGCKYAMNYLSL